MLRTLKVQSSTGKQYSGDSYFREQDFIQTNPRGTLPHILMSCPPSPQPARSLLRPSPSLSHRVTSSQLMRGVQPTSREPSWPISVAGLVSQFSSDIRRRGALSSGGCLYVRALGQAPTAWSPAFGRQARFSALILYTQW
jgi:hypothetical protein